MRYGIIDIGRWRLTPQQQRLFHLQASRKWGNFTDAEVEHLNRIQQRTKSRPEDVERADYGGLIRVLQPGETLANVRTLPMPGER